MRPPEKGQLPWKVLEGSGAKCWGWRTHTGVAGVRPATLLGTRTEPDRERSEPGRSEDQGTPWPSDPIPKGKMRKMLMKFLWFWGVRNPPKA